MKVYFEKVVLPCVVDDVIAWHVSHGWVWDVVEVKSGRRVGVFFCTLLCGDGVIVHCSTAPGILIPWTTTLAAMRKAVSMVAPVVNVVFATIPADNLPLIRCACRLGFRISCGTFDRDGRKIRLLQYFPPSKTILKPKPPAAGNENIRMKGPNYEHCKKREDA